MSRNPHTATRHRRPYLEPALDRWKMATLAVLFFILLLSAMAWVV